MGSVSVASRVNACGGQTRGLERGSWRSGDDAVHGAFQQAPGRWGLGHSWRTPPPHNAA